MERSMQLSSSVASQPETSQTQAILPEFPAAMAAEGETVTSAFTALRTATRAVTQFYDLVLSPTGLKTTQFVILQEINAAGEIAQCDFAREFGIAVPTLSRRFGGLRKKELIQIRLGERHGERIYRLTPKGQEALRAAVPYWERAQRRLKTVLGNEDWDRLLELAERVRKAATHAEQLRTDNHSSAPISLVGNAA